MVRICEAGQDHRALVAIATLKAMGTVTMTVNMTVTVIMSGMVIVMVTAMAAVTYIMRVPVRLDVIKDKWNQWHSAIPLHFI